MPEIKEVLLKRGYVLVIIGGGVTGDIKINDTDLHCLLIVKYWELKKNLMLKQLRPDPKRISQPSRDDGESFNSLMIDVVNRLKALWVTNALDCSEDYSVSERIIALVGSHLKEFWDELMKKESPKCLKQLLRLITPPKGVKRKNQQVVHHLMKVLNCLIVKDSFCKMKRKMMTIPMMERDLKIKALSQAKMLQLASKISYLQLLLRLFPPLLC